MTEFERNFLGTIIGATHRTDLIDDSGIRPEMFSTAKGQAIYKKSCELWQSGITPNLMELSQLLPSLVVELSDLTNQSENIYIKGSVQNIKKDYQLRQIKQLQAITHDANNGNFDDTLIKIQAVIDSVDSVKIKDDMINVKEYYYNYLGKIEERINNKGLYNGVEIKFPLMQKVFSEWSKGCVYCIGARPSDGKSTIGMNLAYQCAQNGYNVGFITTESTKTELLNRMACHVGKFEMSYIKTGMLTDRNMNAFLTVGEVLSEKNFIIYDKPRATISDVTSAMKTMKRKYKCDIIFVDYIQRISVPKYRSKMEEVAHSSGVISEMAKFLDIPIISMAQLKRDIDGGKMPHLGDFQWTSSLEQDIDGGILIWNINPDRSSPEADDYYLIFAKNRDGKTAWVRMLFDKPTLTFSEHPRQCPPPMKARKSRENY